MNNSNRDSLRERATNGMFWSAIDKFAVQAGQFVIGVVLARLLMPKDFGLIGMLSIFIAISQSFIDSGLGSGLIQKKNRSAVDYSTVFVFNLIVSCFAYFLLFISAPYIAAFYKMPQLVILTRVLSLNLIINSLAIVQRSRLIINIDFKTIAKVNVVSVISGGIIGVIFALKGFGVWSLVIQTLSGSAISVIMFAILNRWKPSLLFSRESFKQLFGYGSKLLLAGLYSKALNEVYNMVIGKIYSPSELGYYTRSKSFAEITAGTVTNILHQVTFPILVSIQDDPKRMISAYRNLIKMATFFIFPAMTLLSLLTEPLIRIVLTDKWLPVVPLLQWMCFARIFYPVSAINMNILKAVGRSDLYLKVDLSKFPIIVLTLIIAIPFGVKAVVIGHVISSAIAFFINAYMPGKLFGYGAYGQLKDMLPVLGMTLFMAAVVFLATFFVNSMFLKVIIGGLSGIGVYLLLGYMFQLSEMSEIKILINKFFKR